MTLISVVHVLMALLAAPLMPAGINRVKALLTGRRGQPLLQPYYDLAKLLRKGAVVSTTTTWVFGAGPVVTLAAACSALLIVPFGGAAAPLAFSGDLFVLAAFLALGRFVTILAALDTGSSFEGMGASREATFGALAEPALLLGLAAMARSTASTSLSGLLHSRWAETDPVVLLVIGALALVFLAENSRIPVDDPNTHLELTMIHEVMVLDHGGPDLAFIHYASALKMWILGALIVGLIVPWLPGTPGVSTAMVLVGMAGIVVATGVVESTMARLRMDAIPQFLLVGGALAVVALILGLR